MTTTDSPDPISPGSSAPQPAPQLAPPAKPMQRVMLMLLLVVVVVIGFSLYWMSRRTGPATIECQAFIQDLLAGNLESAKSRCVPNVDFDAMDRLMGKMRFWGKLNDANYVEKASGDRADVDASLNFEKLDKAFQATLQKQSDGKYRITTYSFN